MVTGLLLDEKHSFIKHDLGSFFWMLFWACIHYNGPNERRVAEKWNCLDTNELLTMAKKGALVEEENFLENTNKHFMSY